MSEGRLAENVMHFARLLRAAGLRIGPDRVLDCVRALDIAGAHQFPLRREDWYWTMSAVLLSRNEQRPIFVAKFFPDGLFDFGQRSFDFSFELRWVTAVVRVKVTTNFGRDRKSRRDW